MRITNVEIADFDGAGRTVSVTAVANNKRRTFYVQTHQGRYRFSMRCRIISGYGEDIRFCDYPNFDFAQIVSAANELARTKINRTEFYIENLGYAYTIESHQSFRLMFKNDDFFNDEQSPNDEEYCEVKGKNGKPIVFKTLAEALEHARKMQDEQQ